MNPVIISQVGDTAVTTTVPISGTVTATQSTATSLKTQAENYQGGSAVAAGNPLQVTLANTGANATAVKVDGSAVTQPVSGTVTANAGTGSFTVAQVTATNLKVQAENYQGGSAVASGNPLQVTLANTGANSNKLLVTPDANSAVNIAQLAGTATDVNSGNKSAGTLRVVIATDQPALTNKLLVTPDANSAVNVAQINGVTPLMGAGNSGTGSHRVTIASDQAVIPVGGNVANGASDSGNPLLNGYHALAHGANPTAVSAGQRATCNSNRVGIPWVIGGHPNIVTIEAAYTAAQTNTAIVTVSTGTIIVVTQIQATVDQATTVGVGLRVGFATATTPTTTGVVLTHPGMVPGSGISRGDGSGILGIGADNEDLRITSDVPTSGSLRILVSYYTIES